jgi:YebC/PmpR family DNA-binding regulatory protein
MGRAFEFRKGRKMKRWSAMAKAFTRIGKDIVMAVKEGGPNPEANSRLRAVIQNAKSANMPKENVERAIKKATDKDTANYKEQLFEGYAPHGIAILIETATDNNNRTVANIRSYFNKCNGTMGTQGSVEFMFDHICNFRIPAEGQDVDHLQHAEGIDQAHQQRDGDDAVSSCMYTYRHSSTSRPNGVFTGTVGVRWRVAWTSNVGSGGALPNEVITTPVTVRVDELQALVD